MRRLLVALLLTGVVDVAAALSWPPAVSILTGSMAPTIRPGDAVVLVRDDRPAVGDVVRVHVPPAGRRLGYPATVVHRVVAIQPDGSMQTRGDARDAADPFVVAPGDLEGRVALRIPRGGFALRLLASPPVLLWLALGGVLLAVAGRAGQAGAGASVPGRWTPAH